MPPGPHLVAMQREASHAPLPYPHLVLQEVHVSFSQDQGWSADRPEQQVLGDGQRMVVHLSANHCVNDSREVCASRRAFGRCGVNTCVEPHLPPWVPLAAGTAAVPSVGDRRAAHPRIRVALR